MNARNVLSTMQGGFTTISVVFDSARLFDNIRQGVKFSEGVKQYTYKILTSSDIKEGDFVIVAVKSHDQLDYKVVRVVERHAEPRLDYNANFSYKWVVSKLDTTEYDRLCAVEESMVQILEEAALKREREIARKALIEEFGEDAINAVQALHQKLLK